MLTGTLLSCQCRCWWLDDKVRNLVDPHSLAMFLEENMLLLDLAVSCALPGHINVVHDLDDLFSQGLSGVFSSIFVWGGWKFLQFRLYLFCKTGLEGHVNWEQCIQCYVCCYHSRSASLYVRGQAADWSGVHLYFLNYKVNQEVPRLTLLSLTQGHVGRHMSWHPYKFSLKGPLFGFLKGFLKIILNVTTEALRLWTFVVFVGSYTFWYICLGWSYLCQLRLQSECPSRSCCPWVLDANECFFVGKWQ